MTLTLEEQEKVFNELREMPCGEKTQMESRLMQVTGLTSEKIKDVWDELRLVGLIHHGWDGLGKLRFNLTDFGKRYSDSVLSFRETEERFTRLRNKIGV